MSEVPDNSAQVQDEPDRSKEDRRCCGSLSRRARAGIVVVGLCVLVGGGVVTQKQRELYSQECQSLTDYNSQHGAHVVRLSQFSKRLKEAIVEAKEALRVRKYMSAANPVRPRSPDGLFELVAHEQPDLDMKNKSHDMRIKAIHCRRALQFQLYAQHLKTMVGTARRKAAFAFLMHALERGVPGDFLEAGVAEGGVSIMCLLLMSCYRALDGANPRLAWMADNWAGLPKKTAEADKKDASLHQGQFHITFEQFSRHFSSWISWWNGYAYARRYIAEPVHPDHFRVLKGLFKDTLNGSAELQTRKLAFLRCDGDLYASVWDCLSSAYRLVSPGGWVYVDDYWAFKATREAVDDFFKQEGLPRNILMSVEEYDDALLILDHSTCEAPAEFAPSMLKQSEFRYVARCTSKNEELWKIEGARVANGVAWQRPPLD
eukprot:gnl/MRDRNA2_/MRDRNA2_120363_c0_seq1.p1 gnl/MRDRNA2_/MRDRNA2_120363_c0~~gnl/MRDRNA2_/MRDRNA2_120363_c0_seq1.p1  ORF type:complete len:431 (-),score=65.86 gnl/MRDRNA2_/MRDRNA2_120363_c0_seq1:22-1314(-)